MSLAPSPIINEPDNNEKIKIRGNVIVRQELKSLTPKCDSVFAIVINILLMTIFFTFGIPILIYSSRIIEFKERYSNNNDCSIQNLECIIEFKIKQKMPSPNYIYYELDNFYMNHRDFVKSRIYSQLRGETHINKNNNSPCNGAIYMKEIFNYSIPNAKYMSAGKTKQLLPDDFANPCGLIAKSYFTDEYELYFDEIKPENKILIDETGIANSYDKQYMFKNNKDWKDIQWIDVENEHFIVWMQIESFQNFRKLWGIVKQDIEPGKYYIKIKNTYNTDLFKGNKYLVWSTSSTIGAGQLYGWALIIAGIICLVMIFIIYFLDKMNSKYSYSIDSLKWD